jgi:hypothetical protein
MNIFVDTFETHFHPDIALRKSMFKTWAGIQRCAKLADVPKPEQISVCIKGCLLRRRRRMGGGADAAASPASPSGHRVQVSR